MTEADSSSIEHLSVVMATTPAADAVESTTKRGLVVSSLGDIDFYFSLAVVVVGIIGTATNGLILYAFVASKKHKKHILIFNQNVLDFYSSLWLVISYAVKLYHASFNGTVGYWFCYFIYTDNILWWGMSGSKINLMNIAIQRYLQVVYPVWSKKRLSSWVLFSAGAFAWMVGIIFCVTTLHQMTFVVDGVCMVSQTAAYSIINFILLSAIPLTAFTFCYGRILAAVRRQARIMAGHVAVGQSHMDIIQTNVIKVMIYVTVFYILTNVPADFIYVFGTFAPSPGILGAYYVAMFFTFAYISANPFVYATKFDPVKSVLLSLIPCKNTFNGQTASEDIEIPRLAAVQN